MRTHLNLVPRPIAAVAMAGMVVLAACSGSAATPAASAGGGTGDASPVTDAVITAKNVDFTPKSLTVAAGVPVHLVLDNADAGIPHNLHVTGSGQDVVKSDVVTGPAKLDLPIAALQPGSYSFVCDVHPNMTGTITVPAP